MSGSRKPEGLVARASVLAVALALVFLSATGVSLAQSAGAKAVPTAKMVAASKLTTTAKPRPKGLDTGITVHGWWKIDVHDPDGKLVSHTEFENSLTANDPNGLSGDFALAAALDGSASHLIYNDPVSNSNVDVISTGYATGSARGFASNLVQVVSTDGAQFVSAQFVLPLLSIGLNTSPLLSPTKIPGYNDSSTAVDRVVSQGTGPCVFIDPSTGATLPPSGCVIPTSQALSTSGGSGNTSGATGNQIVLTSSYQAAASTTISQVGTYVTPMTITVSQDGAQAEWFAQLESGHVAADVDALYSLTTASLSTASPCTPTPTAPCAVSVTTGQTISVTVVISFGSGS